MLRDVRSRLLPLFDDVATRGTASPPRDAPPDALSVTPRDAPPDAPRDSDTPGDTPTQTRVRLRRRRWGLAPRPGDKRKRATSTPPNSPATSLPAWATATERLSVK